MSAPATTREAVEGHSAAAIRLFDVPHADRDHAWHVQADGIFLEMARVANLIDTLTGVRDVLKERAEKAEAERDAERERGRELSGRHATLWRNYIERTNKRDAALAEAGRMREALLDVMAKARGALGEDGDA